MPLGLHHLSTAAADLVLLGDLTGRYAAGSYSRLSSDGLSVVARPDRQGEADHGHRITAAIACHVARAGGTLDQLVPLLMHPDHEGGRHARTIALRSGQARALDYVRRVWVSASAAVSSTVTVEARQHAHEDLAGLRDRIETTPWRGERGRTALRILRAHLNFAETAGGRQHSASERQTAEEAGVSRQALRNAYESVLKPNGWLHRLRIGHGRDGSTWYLGDGRNDFADRSSSRIRTTQFPPDRELEEWPTPETTTADIDSTLISRLMGHDAFAHQGLGSSALMVIGALHVRPGQTATELVASSSVSRATVYRTLQRLAAHGLVTHNDRAWTLTPRVLEDIGQTNKGVAPSPEASTAQRWDAISHCYGTTGTAQRRKALHDAERTAYRQALEQRAEHRSKALFVVHDDGRLVLVPAPRGDEIPAQWQPPSEGRSGPATTHTDCEWTVATDGRLILITPADQRTYDELVAAHAEAINEWESAA
ncbi:MarR family transcriptional regulator [Streptomyces sp. ISL-98]|uniref:MarR family transcriptional regulator n=1 Tax=Streptomyces sp. ISL-98 TaxID=2819192 RepID=UPI0027E3E267|nr:MarR family transcriptional regulator [Streptomyces sp. ISL-98]